MLLRAARGRLVPAGRGNTPADLLVVGLGNPGAKYERTRHNVGAEVIAVLARRHDARLRPLRAARSLVAEVAVGDKRVVLVFPQTFMNDSGAAVGPLARRHHLEGPERIIVVHDEMDLPVGRVKLKLGGGTAGHNGLASVRAHLHTDRFARVRIGIGKPPGSQAGTDYVLKTASRADRKLLDVAVEEAADAVEAVIAEGLDAAMTHFNARSDNR